MISADFLAGANLDNGDPETLLFSMSRSFRVLPEEQKQAFLDNLNEKASWRELLQKPRAHGWIPSPTRISGNKYYDAMAGAANAAARCQTSKCTQKIS